MNVFIVIYQLENSRENYPLLSKRLKGYSNWAEIYPQTWLIKTREDIKTVRSVLASTINQQGNILVIDVTDSSWASSNVDKEVTTWLKENL